MKDLIFTCDCCKHKNIASIEEEYDLTRNVDLYNKISSDSLFNFKCLECGKNILVDFEGSFFDNDYKFFIRYSSSKDMFLVSSENNYKYIRFVNDLNDLKEKLRIFYSFLDDRIIEIIKEMIKEDLIKNNDNIDIDAIYFHHLNNKKLDFLLFSKTDYLGTISYKMDGYLKLLNEYLTLLDSSQHIDSKYAKKLIKKYNTNI